jgi:tetratricopeptide (TPR) repeat protein
MTTAHLGILDSKVTASPDYVGQYSQTSLRPVANYVERPLLQQKLKKQLSNSLEIESNEGRLVVVHGLGGSGKSQLVLHYVQQYRLNYSAIFWIEAGQRESVERDYLQIYRRLFEVHAVSGHNIKIEDAVLAVKSWFQNRRKRWLFIFDSVDNLDQEDDQSYVDLRHFIPDDASVYTIITTRSSIAKDLSRLEPIEVAEMEASEAKELFMKYSKLKQVSPDAEEEVPAIVEELGHLALAITLAGSYVSATPRMLSDIRQYLPEYRQRRKILLSEKPKKLIHQYGESVLTTWETSMTAVASQSQEASQFLILLAFLHFDDIFLDLFGEPVNDEVDRQYDTGNRGHILQRITSSQEPFDIHMVEAAFRTLQSYSLLRWRQDQSSYSMHKLVHAWAYDRLNRKQQHRFSLITLLLLADIVSNSKPDPVYKARLIPHLMANFTIISGVYREMDRDGDIVLDILSKTSDFMDEAGYFAEVFVLRSYLFNQTRKLHGENSINTILAMSNLASTLGDQGQLEEAALMMKEVLEKMRRILGEEHPDTISAMNNLASTLADQGQLEEAALMMKEVLEKRRRILGEEHPRTISAMNNLASTLGGQGQLEEGVLMMKEVLEKMRRILGEEHPNTISALNNLEIMSKFRGGK